MDLTTLLILSVFILVIGSVLVSRWAFSKKARKYGEETAVRGLLRGTMVVVYIMARRGELGKRGNEP